MTAGRKKQWEILHFTGRIQVSSSIKASLVELILGEHPVEKGAAKCTEEDAKARLPLPRDSDMMERFKNFVIDELELRDKKILLGGSREQGKWQNSIGRTGIKNFAQESNTSF